MAIRDTDSDTIAAFEPYPLMFYGQGTVEHSIRTVINAFKDDDDLFTQFLDGLPISCSIKEGHSAQPATYDNWESIIHHLLCSYHHSAIIDYIYEGFSVTDRFQDYIAFLRQKKLQNLWPYGLYFMDPDVPYPGAFYPK